MIEADFSWSAAQHERLSRGQHEVGTDQCSAELVTISVMPSAARSTCTIMPTLGATVLRMSPAAVTQSISRNRAASQEQRGVECRLVVIGIEQERIAVRIGGRIAVAVMPLAAAEAVERDAAGCRAVGDVTYPDLAVHERRRIDRPRPEFGIQRRRDHVLVVAELDLDPVVGRQVEPLQMQDDELGAAGRRRAGVQIDHPGIARGRRQSRIGADHD